MRSREILVGLALVLALAACTIPFRGGGAPEPTQVRVPADAAANPESQAAAGCVAACNGEFDRCGERMRADRGGSSARRDGAVFSEETVCRERLRSCLAACRGAR